MHIIKKPKQYKLPYLIQKRLISQSSQKQIPSVYIQSKIHKKKSKSLLGNDKVVSYIQGNDLSQYRPSIRKAISNNMSFEHNQSRTVFFPEQIIKKLNEPVKAVSYSSQKYQYIYKSVKQIFGQDIHISKKDIISAYGAVTQSFYVFFTSIYYQPYSICCRAIIYLKIQNSQSSPSNRLAKLETSNDFFGKNNNVANKFKCSKCSQTVLNIIKKSQKSLEMSRSLGKQALHFEAQRQKISMSIIVASGKFKNIRIDSIQLKDVNLDPEHRYKAIQRNNLKNNNKTLPFRASKAEIA